MLRKIYRELVQIRKELHAIWSGIKFFPKGLTKELITLLKEANELTNSLLDNSADT